MDKQTPPLTQQEKVVDDYLKQRDTKSNPIMVNALISMFEKDLPAFDAHYIERRLREVLENAINSMDFTSPKFLAIVREVLPEFLDQLRLKIPAQLEYEKKTKDLTVLRDARCEPVVYELIKAILTPELLFTDEAFMEIDVKSRNQKMFTEIIMTYVEAVTEGLLFSLQESLRRANKFLWEGKDKDGITLKQIDKVLKKDIKPLQADKKKG